MDQLPVSLYVLTYNCMRLNRISSISLLSTGIYLKALITYEFFNIFSVFTFPVIQMTIPMQMNFVKRKRGGYIAFIIVLNAQVNH